MKHTNRTWIATALLALAVTAAAQQRPAPSLNAQQPNAPAAQLQPRTPTFPAVDPANFTATSPTADEVNAFLKAMWGYDENRVWSVAAILATPAPGVSKVVVFLADKTQPARGQQAVFFTTPDGKHVIADNVMPFGPKPFAEARKLLQDRAEGPARGAKEKDLLLVEFTDLQCPHCRDAQSTLNNLVQDFPKARIVVQEFPVAGRPLSLLAAKEGVCVRKLKGDDAFFRYEQAVYDSQDSLTAEHAETTLGAAAAKAGADSAAAAACAKTPEAKAAVDASVALGRDIGVIEGPMLAINGHLIPLSILSYDALKRIIVYQANQDGLSLTLQPSLRSLQ